ncbi:MAG: protein kinase [Candidatus Aminicenantes bacterium]|nr:protein kinase [Candidatus Aminicenantes bacterium]
MKKRFIFLFVFFLFFSSLYAQRFSLVVITSPAVPGADVYLNNRRIGALDRQGSGAWENISEGRYSLRVTKEGYRAYESRIDIVDGVTSTKTINMVRLVTKVLVDSNVGSADVYLDGEFKGRTTFEGRLLIANIAPGNHRLKIVKEGYKTFQYDFEILERHAGTTYTIEQNLGGEGGGSGVSLIIFIVILVSGGVFALVFLIIKVIGSFKTIRGRFDQYVIIDILGKGGMSTVYRATDLVSKTEVALKIMDDRYLHDRDMINKFEREGKGLSLINQHFPDAPVVKVFRYGRENSSAHGRPFLALEILRGPSLLALLDKNIRFSLSFAVNVIRQISYGLMAAHSLKIYHRDVSPDNVIITRNHSSRPQLKLFDFGVAKHEYIEVGTLDGTISGKPPYMSPEQCRGTKVDARSDIYSLGIIFYTMLAGHPPFVSKNPLDVMYQHENKTVPLIQENYHDKVKKIVYKMLEKTRSKRYQSIEELIKDLDSFGM